MKPEISVIIPVYNTSEYLVECLKSLQKQSFHNYEAILIDDGSIDDSGIICDKFAERDDRFKVIHKTNGGVSSARNIGLEVAISDFIFFLDSDDTMDSSMLESLYHIAMQTNADIVQSGFCKNMSEDKYLKRYTRNEALDSLFGAKEIKSALWLCLFKRVLFNGLKFPEHIHHWEDYALLAVLIKKSSLIVTTPIKYYNYSIREDSACHVKINRKTISCLMIDKYLDANKVYRNKQDRYNVRSFFIASCYGVYLVNGNVSEYRKIIRNKILHNWYSILMSKSIARNTKIMLYLFCISGELCNAIHTWLIQKTYKLRSYVIHSI